MTHEMSLIYQSHHFLLFKLFKKFNSSSPFSFFSFSSKKHSHATTAVQPNSTTVDCTVNSALGTDLGLRLSFSFFPFGSKVSVDGKNDKVDNPDGGFELVYGTRIRDNKDGYHIGNLELHGRDR